MLPLERFLIGAAKPVEKREKQKERGLVLIVSSRGATPVNTEQQIPNEPCSNGARRISVVQRIQQNENVAGSCLVCVTALKRTGCLSNHAHQEDESKNERVMSLICLLS